MAAFSAVVVTCEHARNDVPKRYKPLFERAGDILQTHRGWDPGALVLAREGARRFSAPLLEGRVTRLLADLNRSEGSRSLFSEFTRELPRAEREAILERYYRPYRAEVLDAIRDAARGGRVLHLSCHSFTPVLKGEVRNADVGLLYDPARAAEVRVCKAIRAELARLLPNLRVRMNYPYRGTSDSVSRELRVRWPDRQLASIEIELNQHYAAQPASQWAEIRRALLDAVQTSLA